MKIFFSCLALTFGILLFGGETLAVAEDFVDRIHEEGETYLEAPPEEYIDPTLHPEVPVKERVLNVVNYILTFVGLIAVIMMIYFGFLWLTSGGNDEQVEKGKKGIIYVALGILLILFSYVLVNFFITAGSGGDLTGT